MNGLKELRDLVTALNSEEWRLEKNTAAGFLPYRVVETKITEGVRGASDGENDHVYIAEACGFGSAAYQRAAFIAAANPAVIISLLSSLEKEKYGAKELCGVIAKMERTTSDLRTKHDKLFEELQASKKMVEYWKESALDSDDFVGE
jgi:hypothetical protein